ncbi:MAG: histidine kinase [Mogibacterium sp.]|nr:histidine kinase [Mogibacterium sp.]
MATNQKLNWGSIKWIYEPEEGSMNNMRIGISTMNPHTEQPPHIHYGDEQLVYIISGKGRQWINDEEMLLEPGTYCHIPAGIVHRQVNDSSEPLVKLLASIPALQSVNLADKAQSMHGAESPESEYRREIREDILKSIISELFNNELSQLRVPITIFDANGSQVYRSSEFPAFCCKNCRLDDNIENCEFLNTKKDSDDMANAYVCKFGLWVYNYPVILQGGSIIGYIKAGHVRTHVDPGSSGYGAVSANQISEAVYSVPESTVSGIMETTKRIAQAIKEKYEVAVMQSDLRDSARELSDSQNANITLQSTLKDTKTKAFNLQLNQHFLFNTLNALAGMAVTENAFTTYDGICDLADLLRYTLRNTEAFVQLDKELAYVQNYTRLQQLRFGDRLKVYYEIPDEILKVSVPFNFLQPIVENCFVHGFRNRKSAASTELMSIIIAAEKTDDGQIEFTIADNGAGIDEARLSEVRREINSKSDDHGTLMVVRKLASLYADSFSYNIYSDGPEKGCKVIVRIPV